MTTLNRQPAGTPAGGQFATGVRGETGTELVTSGGHGKPFVMLEPLGDGDPVGPFQDEIDASIHIDENGLDEDHWKLVTRSIDPDHTGSCSDCDGHVGVLNGKVVHLDHNGVPDAHLHSHEADVDPHTYDGGDVDTVAAASGWGGTAWEKYEDARAERNVTEAYEAGLSEAKAATVAGIDLTGSASDVRTRAQQALWDAQAVYEIAGAKSAALDIIAEHPAATVLELEENYDDDGSTSWDGGRILDANGKHIADFVDFSDDHWSSITDLPTQPKVHVHQNGDGTASTTGDSRYAFMSWEGNRRQGYTAKVDLKAAAAVDLTTLTGGGR